VGEGGLKAFTCICLLCSLIVDISRMLQDHWLHRRHWMGARKRDHNNIADLCACVIYVIYVRPAPRNYPDEIFDLSSGVLGTHIYMRDILCD